MKKAEKIIFYIMEIIMLLTVNVIQSVFICIGIYYFTESKYTVGCVCLLINCVLVLKNRHITLEYNTNTSEIDK